MTDGPIRVTMLFRFGTDGLISAFYVEDRATTESKTTVLMTWESRLSNDQPRDGMRLPLTGEALYIPQQGEKPYFKGTIDTPTYEFAP